MLKHNLSQDFNLNDIWNKRNQLSQEENTVLERLTWENTSQKKPSIEESGMSSVLNL